MQAIILAAGMGIRLRPLTENIPKALTEIHGKPMLLNTLEILHFYKIQETIIVLGYLGEKIQEICKNNYKDMKITYIWNHDFKITNNNYSLYLTKNYIKEDVILLECDLFYEKILLKDIISFKGECGILVSNYNPNTMDGTVIYADNEGKAYYMQLKENSNNIFIEGAKKTVNVYYFQKKFWKNIFMTALENYINFHDKKNYYEKVLGALIFYGDSDIRIVEVDESMWAEVDNEADLELAEKKFSYQNS